MAANSAANLSLAEARAKLMSHFTKYGGENYTEGWSKLWDDAFLPWDRMRPSPALGETLSEHAAVIGNALTEVDGKQQRKKALVPGCGRGVDVCLLESFGYDAVGLEYSSAAVAACEKYAEEHAAEYPIDDAKVGKGSKVFVQGDFYKDDWLEKTGLGVKQFDLIYDYTVGIRLFHLLFPLSDCHLMSSSSVPCTLQCARHGSFSTMQSDLPGVSNQKGRIRGWTAVRIALRSLRGAFESSRRADPI